MSVHARPPHDHGQFTKAAAGRVAGAGIFHSVEDSFEVLHCAASCRCFPTANHSAAQKSRWLFRTRLPRRVTGAALPFIADVPESAVLDRIDSLCVDSDHGEKFSGRLKAADLANGHVG